MLLEAWLADIDADGNLEDYQFTRLPLVVNLQFGAHALQILVMHTKPSTRPKWRTTARTAKTAPVTTGP